MVLVDLRAVLAPPVQAVFLILLLAGAPWDALPVRLGEAQAGPWRPGLLGEVKRLFLAGACQKTQRGRQAEPPPPPEHSCIQVHVHDPVLDLHMAGEIPLQSELAGAVAALEGPAVRVQVHMAHQVMHSVELLPTQLAFVGFNVRVDDHVGLEGLFLDKALEAEVALVGPDVSMDQDVTLHVGQKGELTTTDTTLVLLHPLMCECVLFEVMGLYKLHATLAADVWPDVFVLHHVVLQLTGVLEALLALTTPVEGGSSVGRQVSLELGQSGEV